MDALRRAPFAALRVHKDPDGRWRFRTVVRLPDGSNVRVNGTAPKHENTKDAAQRAERIAINEALNPTAAVVRSKKEVPTYSEWFKGRFWQESGSRRTQQAIRA
jgi:hypothetical protein